MKITKSIETFDPSVFDIGKVYYINFASSKTLILCVSRGLESVSFKRILQIKGNIGTDFSLDNSNYQSVEYICPIDFNVEFDSTITSWLIGITINEEY